MSSPTFSSLIEDLSRDVYRVQPKDALQFCANWFQSRLEEQRSRTRDVISRSNTNVARELPIDFYRDVPIISSGHLGGIPGMPMPTHRNITPEPPAPWNITHRSSRASISPSPFGRLDVPGNALLSSAGPPTFQVDDRELPPMSPLTTNPNPFAYNDHTIGLDEYLALNPNPSPSIFARRSSISAESILVDSIRSEHFPTFVKTPEQLARIKASMSYNFIFRELDEEQETGVLNAMQEKKVAKDEVVIRQGDVGDYFYVVESGMLHCFIRSDPVPPMWNPTSVDGEEKFLQPGYHPEFGKKVAECKPGTSFGELALMYGHPRAASVVAMEESTLWALDRITFRSVILKAAHRRRTMYEDFLSSVTLLCSLDASERSKIADALVSRVYQDGEAVVRQGEMGDTFFFVEEGEAVVTKTTMTDDGRSEELTLSHYKKGDYFGGN